MCFLYFISAPIFVSDDCKNSLEEILKVEPADRPSIEEIMNHPWIKKTYEKIELSSSDHEQIGKSDIFFFSIN